MDKEKINVIFEMVSNDISLTKEELLSRDITEEDINYLLNKEYIYKYNDEVYFIKYIGDLLDYAKDLMIDKKFSKSENAIRKCYEYTTDDFEITNFMFLNEIMHAIRSKDFEKSIIYLKELKEIADEYQERDVNTYIFLLSTLTTLPDDLRLEAKFMKYDDVLIKKTDDRYDDQDTRNTIRKNIYFQKYTVSLRETKKIEDKTTDNMVYDRTIAKLLEEAAYNKKNINKKINHFAKNKEVEKISDLYDEEDAKRPLTKHEEYVRLLAKKIINIKETQSIPKSSNKKDLNLYDLIDNNNFDAALEKTIELQKRTNMPLEESIYYLLLITLNEEIEKIKVVKKLALNNKAK